MVIVKITQCLKELNDEVKKKIKEKQDELLSTETFATLEERLESPQFREKLLKTLTNVEKKYFITFIRKYSIYHENGGKEEQLASSEEKLALLLLRQKGLLFEVETRNQHQRYVIPIEVVQSYIELTVTKDENTLIDQDVVSTKQYLHILIEVLLFIKEEKIKKASQLDSFTDRISLTSIDGELLINYLVHERLLKKTNGGYIVLDENCDQFFKRKNKDIQQSLTLFIATHYLKDFYIVFYIVNCFRKGSITIEEIQNFVTQYGQESIANVNEFIEQLTLLNIITKSTEGVIVVQNEEDDYYKQDQKQGMVVGKCEFLIPAYVDNEALWIFRCWGEIVQWEAMVHISFKRETILNALTMNRDVQKLFDHLEKFIAKVEVSAFEETVKKWLEHGRPIKKKTKLTFYEVSEKLHVKYIEQHWQHWWAKSDSGITIEKEFEAKFEQLLQKCSVTVVMADNKEHELQPPSPITVNNSFPYFGDVFPEVEKLPKQWFSLTAYEEKALQRIIKQAIILKIPIEVKDKNEDIIIVHPLKIQIENGSYTVLGQDNKSVSLQQIKKLAIVHPLKNLNLKK